LHGRKSRSTVSLELVAYYQCRFTWSRISLLHSMRNCCHRGRVIQRRGLRYRPQLRQPQPFPLSPGHFHLAPRRLRSSSQVPRNKSRYAEQSYRGHRSSIIEGDIFRKWIEEGLSDPSSEPVGLHHALCWCLLAFFKPDVPYTG
jgi:hypothetical protein